MVPRSLGNKKELGESMETSQRKKRGFWCIAGQKYRWARGRDRRASRRCRSVFAEFGRKGVLLTFEMEGLRGYGGNPGALLCRWAQ